MVSQKDIARELNLSVATVSRTLRGVPGHNAETTAEVIMAATRLGYRVRHAPPAAGRDAPRAFQQFGALVLAENLEGKINSLVYARMLQGMSDAAQELNVGLNLSYCLFERRAQAHLDANLPPALREGRLNGLLLVGEFPPETVQAFSRKLPCIHVNFHERGVCQDYVGQDHYRSVELLMEHLFDRGHRRIGFLGNNPSFTYARARYGGYVEALAMLGLKYDPRCVIDTQQASPASRPYAQVLEQIGRGVAAWICLHDRMGYDLATYLAGRGMRIPQRVSLCGFDDLPPPHGIPKLTTIGFPFEDIGAASVRRLFVRLQKPAEQPVNITYSGRLIEGDSVGRPPNVALPRASKKAPSRTTA